MNRSKRNSFCAIVLALVFLLGTNPTYTIAQTGSEEEIESSPELMSLDPNITYSTITVSDNTHGANAIEDSVLYSNRVNRNYGDYVYDRVGTPSDTYGIGRTLVRLSGLISLTEYCHLRSQRRSQFDRIFDRRKEIFH